MSDIETLDRAALLEELAHYLGEPFLTIAREQSTTEELRDTVKGAREQIAWYEAMGFKDMQGHADG